MNRRVVVTGLGVVSSIGVGKDEFWKNLIAGKSGISDIEAFDTNDYPSHKGGEVKNFEPAKFIAKKNLKNIARASQFAIAATSMALKDSQFDIVRLSHEKTAVVFGTTMGEGGMIEEIDKHWAALGEEDIWAITISKYPCNAIADNLSRFFNLSGKSFVLPTACSAGNYSIGYGYDLIRSGIVDVALAGGADPLSRIGFTGFSRLYAMSPDLCRPFDRNRKGMMVGEGAGVLILEDLESARKRNATIYAEILGYGLGCDAYHMTAPRVSGIIKVIEKAIANSRIKKEDIDYICAHGTGTPPNDKAECEAIKSVFSDLAKNLSISSIKSMLGHTMGAASAIEAISCCLTIKDSIIPPTINYETLDPECNLDCVPNKAKKRAVNIVLNNSLAFGGNNACLVLGKPVL
ncbi:MAG: hypothetical protein A2Z72_01960 [Omnitrophica bacterium RBG_13_46_9]|nr:MAG: hypothetical protein A2Z72_01960 [Omnitrophica bacterium RBG_13_46_9]